MFFWKVAAELQIWTEIQRAVKNFKKFQIQFKHYMKFKWSI